VDVYTYVPPPGEETFDLKLRYLRSYLINPGSVGQPRDRDSRASFLVFDNEAMRVTFRRVEYDIDSARAKIEAFGLPKQSSQRLALGR
jgi:diadenosine tetraphosphatase ApaH/serine/threonine PP2A family protein phosphatase